MIPVGCEMPQSTNLKQQILDNNSFQEATRPLFFSNSPPKKHKKYYYKGSLNIFADNSIEKEISMLRQAYLKTINFEQKLLIPDHTNQPNYLDEKIREN